MRLHTIMNTSRCIFVLSLEGDARNRFCDFPDDSFNSLQAIIDTFKNIYENQGGLPCASNTMKKHDSNPAKDPNIIERCQENVLHQSFPSRNLVTALMMNPLVSLQEESLIVERPG